MPESLYLTALRKPRNRDDGNYIYMILLMLLKTIAIFGKPACVAKFAVLRVERSPIGLRILARTN